MESLNMFEIKKIKFGNLESVKLVNTKTGESASILPHYGANLYELILLKNNRLNGVIKGFDTEDAMVEHHGFYSSHLFPFAGRLPDGKFSYEGKEYFFEINDMEFQAALHGFLYNQPMDISWQRCNEKAAEICFYFSSENVHISYPFSVDVNISYKLDESGLTCTTFFLNQGKVAAPIAYGVHPYFRFDTKVDNLEIKITAEKETLLSDRLVPSGKTKPNNDFINFSKISTRFFDNGFQFPRKEGVVTTQLKNPSDNVIINIWQETGKHKFNFLQVYTPPTRDCVAIEPLCGNINSLNNKDDLMVLEPKQSASLQWGVKLT